MIINTGCRTDIPAYFSEWFFNRLKSGYVYVRNPYYPKHVSRYILSPDIVDCIAFCTKNPAPVLPRIHELDSFGQFWFVTITPYGKEIEPEVPPKGQVIKDFKKLSGLIGREKTGWRYDPVFISGRYSVEYHISAFRETAAALAGCTDFCVISFIDLYAKTRCNFPGASEVSSEDRRRIGDAFARIGREYGIAVRTCVEGEDLERYGVDCRGCMTQEVLERALGTALRIPRKRAVRSECDCLLGNDIGVYNTCRHGCVYCYANHDREIVAHNFSRHDPESPFLIGNSEDGDIIKSSAQKSFIDDQNFLF